MALATFSISLVVRVG
ncbi:hypothetical protein HY065_00540 [Candidatus Berkelbacteria bacterium]|nr:hypothetical protein [Candidatus Berkelbacteria bacterium]